MAQGPNLLLTCFLNKILSKHNHTPLLAYCLWLCSCYSLRVGMTQTVGLQSLKYLRSNRNCLPASSLEVTTE